MENAHHHKPDHTNLIVLLIIVISFCVYCFWIGTACVRLWFYKGALGPEPERFIIIPQHRKERMERERLRKQNAGNNRMTVFPIIEQDEVLSNPFADDAYPADEQDKTTPSIAMNDTADNDDKIMDFSDLGDPEKIRKYLAEEQRISRLPAFEQDDCGDGSQFPDVPYADKPTPQRQKIRLSAASRLSTTREYLELGLKKVDSKHFLVVDNTYIEQYETRDSLLNRKRSQCIHTTVGGEYACEELMKDVTHVLAEQYPEYFNIAVKNRSRKIRCEITGAKYSLIRPFDVHPIEVCARIAVEDFTVFIRNEFTQRWYLQASATLFPSGYRMSRYIGKPLNAIIDDNEAPMSMWEDLPHILDIVSTTPRSLFTRTSTYIQTSPPNASLASTLHITRPADFFAGDLSNLHPESLHIRREIQTFKILKDSSAVAMVTRTELRKLADLDERERRELMSEIQGWDEDEASFKGKALWIRAVKAACEGGNWMKDDGTVLSAGVLTRYGE